MKLIAMLATTFALIGLAYSQDSQRPNKAEAILVVEQLTNSRFIGKSRNLISTQICSIVLVCEKNSAAERRHTIDGGVEAAFVIT